MLTKTDQLSAPAIAALHDEVATALTKRPAAVPTPLATSARSGAGIAELRGELAALAGA